MRRQVEEYEGGYHPQDVGYFRRDWHLLGPLPARVCLGYCGHGTEW